MGNASLIKYETNLRLTGASRTMKCSLLNRVAVWSAVLSSVSCAALLLAGEAPLAELKVPAELTSEQFAEYHALVKPAAHESPWAKISWQASVWEARQRAAAEGKPVLIWSGGGAPPLGVC
jgi:hypothetical protein